jgi:hypothetical protein
MRMLVILVVSLAAVSNAFAKFTPPTPLVVALKRADDLVVAMPVGHELLGLKPGEKRVLFPETLAVEYRIERVLRTAKDAPPLVVGERILVPNAPAMCMSVAHQIEVEHLGLNAGLDYGKWQMRRVGDKSEPRRLTEAQLLNEFLPPSEQQWPVLLLLQRDRNSTTFRHAGFDVSPLRWTPELEKTIAHPERLVARMEAAIRAEERKGRDVPPYLYAELYEAKPELVLKEVRRALRQGRELPSPMSSLLNPELGQEIGRLLEQETLARRPVPRKLFNSAVGYGWRPTRDLIKKTQFLPSSQ